MIDATIPNVPVDESDKDLFGRLFSTWSSKRERNLLRTVYYEGKNALKDFGISVPPQMQKAYTPLQWIAKGVNAVTGRSEFEGFVSSSGSDDPFDMAGLLADNHFFEEFPQATKSSAIHACSFITVTDGDTASGEPDVLYLARAADMSAAVWDRRRRCLAGFLSIVEMDGYGPSEIVFYTPFWVYSLVRRSNVWRSTKLPNRLGEVPVARLAFEPELNRPFGSSRITRTSMGLTDAAVRTLLRSEVSAEFYMSDKYWLFGADVTKFIGDDKWSAVMGRMNAIDTEDGEEISIQRFQGSSPQPHIDQLRMIQSMFADDQDLDVKFADASNPSSADAIYAAKEDLIVKVRNANRTWGRGAVKAFQLGVQLRDNSGMTDELRGLSAQFTDPAIVSPSARADAFSKLSANIESFGSSPVGMKYAGLPLEDITQFMAWKQKQDASSRLTQLTEAVRGLRSGDSGAGGGVSAGESGSDGSGSGAVEGLSQ